MEIEVTKSSTVKVEVQLPYYSKTSRHFFKVLGPDRSISIYEGTQSCGIEIRFHTASCFDESNELSSEAEFKEAFERISARLIMETFHTSQQLSQQP